MSETKRIITCVVCGLDNALPIPEGVLPDSESEIKAGDVVSMVRTDEGLGIGVCDRRKCGYKIQKWDSGDKSFEYLD